MKSVYKLLLLDDLLAVARFPSQSSYPECAQGEVLVALVRTPEELTIVCSEKFVPPGVKAEPGWRALQVEGPLAFSQVGVLASLASPLAEAGVSVFVISTFSTDYLFVKANQLDQATTTLQKAGHTIIPEIRS
jgi:hypothetical protein